MVPDLRFKDVILHRSSYRVTYMPTWEKWPFAAVQLSYIETPVLEQIVVDMETEAKIWASKYAVPVMVSAFDVKSDLVHLTGLKDRAQLMAFMNEGKVELHWEELPSDQLPYGLYSNEDLVQIYFDLEYRTLAERMEKVKKQAKGMKIFKFILALSWLIPPVFMFVTGLAFPLWGIAVGLYAIYQAIIRVSKLMGWMAHNKSDKEKSERKRKMEHYFHHCEQNPVAFERLKCENFRNETIAKNRLKFEN